MALRKKKIRRPDLEEIKKEWEKECKLTGQKIRERYISHKKGEVRSAKQELKWSRKIIRLLNRLEKRNPEQIEMDHSFDLSDEEEFHWCDVMIKLPHIFRWKWHWVYTIFSLKFLRDELEKSNEFGLKIPLKEPEDNIDKFDRFYAEDGTITKDKLIGYYEEWVKIFLPKFSGKIKTGTYN